MSSGDKIFAEGGGMQIRDKNGEVIGAVGVTGDTEDRDEELAAHGIHAVGLKTDEDCKDMGRKFRQRLTSGRTDGDALPQTERARAGHNPVRIIEAACRIGFAGSPADDVDSYRSFNAISRTSFRSTACAKLS